MLLCKGKYSADCGLLSSASIAKSFLKFLFCHCHSSHQENFPVQPSGKFPAPGNFSSRAGRRKIKFPGVKFSSRTGSSCPDLWEIHKLGFHENGHTFYWAFSYKFVSFLFLLLLLRYYWAFRYKFVSFWFLLLLLRYYWAFSKKFVSFWSL